MQILLQVAKLYSVFTCALFSGSSVYISLAEHPARMECGTETAATQFAISYRLSAMVQAGLVMMCPIFSLVGWAAGASIWWLIAGVMVGALVPYTFMFVSPINRQLADPTANKDSAQTKALLLKWGKVHSVRSIVSLIAFIIFLLNM